MRGPVLIQSEDVETLLELAEGLALCPTHLIMMLFVSESRVPIHLRSAPDEGIDAEEWMIFSGK